MSRIWKEAGLPAAIREKRALVKRFWEKREHQVKFLKDHSPLEAEKIRWCSTRFRKREDHNRPGHYSLWPVRCHQLPWCIICAQMEEWRRVQPAMDTFALATPAGQQIRHAHIVQTAPVYDDGTGWGMHASKDLTTFLHIVWETLQTAYGDGLGALMSYQDFGEECFAKRHPHADLSLNGWAVVDGKPRRLDEYSVKGNGRAKWDQWIVEAARHVWPDAKRGNVKIQKFKEGIPSLHDTLKYQMREMVDLRKLRYSREKKAVYWENHDTGAQTKMPVLDFLAGLAEYEYRLGAWQKKNRQALHRRFGIMGDRLLDETAEAIGGKTIPHGKDCLCSECVEWDVAILENVDHEAGPPRPSF